VHRAVKTVQFIEALYKGDIVVRDIKQQRTIIHHYKISNFNVTHSQKNPTELTMYNGEVLRIHEHPQPLSKDDQMIQIDIGRKLKMAATAILKVIGVNFV